jgi:hypothetical protein
MLVKAMMTLWHTLRVGRGSNSSENKPFTIIVTHLKVPALYLGIFTAIFIVVFTEGIVQ